jgi:hypothetical protein
VLGSKGITKRKAEFRPFDCQVKEKPKMDDTTTPPISGLSQVSEDHWQKIGAAGGIAFVALQLASQMLIQIGGSEPVFNAPTEEIVAYFLNRNLLFASIGGFLSIVSIIIFLWFLGVLWATLQDHEGEPAWLSLLAFASGVVGMAIMLGGSGWELAFLRLGDGLSAEIIQLLFDQGNLTFANFWVALASMLLATGIITIRYAALPRWLGWFALLLAAALLSVRAVWFTASGIKFMPYVLFWIWLSATSVTLYRRMRAAAAE